MVPYLIEAVIEAYSRCLFSTAWTTNYGSTYYVLILSARLLFRYELLELAAHLHVGVEVVGDLVVGDRALPARAHEQAAPRLPGDGVALERRAAALA
eukprot:scaffold46439_cov61-Phaeocystis_antarctica.AAC.3